MTPIARKIDLENIQSLRALYLQETNFQIRYDACHERGWTDSYLLMLDDLRVGYGSIKGREIKDRDTVFEYYVVPPFRKRASGLFRQLLEVSEAQYIECQSNDLLLSSMLYEFSRSVSADVVLFEDHAVTELAVPGALVRPRRSGDEIFEHRNGAGWKLRGGAGWRDRRNRRVFSPLQPAVRGPVHRSSAGPPAPGNRELSATRAKERMLPCRQGSSSPV